METPTISFANAQRPLFVGVDVGGTNVKLGLVDDLGRTVASARYTNETRLGRRVAIERMNAAVADLISSVEGAGDEIPVVGLATPGTMDLSAGMILQPPNLPGWEQFSIRDLLSNACGRPVVFCNDATAAAFGEYWVGSGRDCTMIILLTLGTGIGAGIIIEGRTINGFHSHGSENGHTLIDTNPDARLCGCGQPGHLEAYASATALSKRAGQLLEQGRESSLHERVNSGEPLNGLMLAQAAEAGDELALDVILEGAKYLAWGIVNAVHTIDPEIVVLGGAMNFGGDGNPIGKKYIEAVRAEFRSRTFPYLAERTSIEYAQLAGDAGYIGAAGIARKSLAKSC